MVSSCQLSQIYEPKTVGFHKNYVPKPSCIQLSSVRSVDLKPTRHLKVFPNWSVPTSLKGELMLHQIQVQVQVQINPSPGPSEPVTTSQKAEQLMSRQAQRSPS